MLDARQENAKMLATLLGVDESEASSRLDVAIAVTFDRRSASCRQLAEQVRELLGRTVTTHPKSADIGYVAEVVIGDSSPAHSENVIWVSMTPRGALINDARPALVQVEPTHPALSLVVACYSTAVAIQKAFGNQLTVNARLPVELDWALIFGPDLEYLTRRVDVGEVVLAGAGAIGNGFLLALRHFDIGGTINVCDPKAVTPGGLNRCMWFSDVDVGRMKAERISELAQPFFRSTKIVPHTCTVHDLLKERGSGALIETLVVATDSRRVRRSLQSELPHRVFDASTTDVREFVLHFNELPTHLACLSCIYPENERERSHEAHVAEVLGVTLQDVQQGFVSPEVAERIRLRYPDVATQRLVGRAFDTLFKELCGEGRLRAAEDRQVLAPFAFVSVLAGTYLAIEFVRRMYSGAMTSPFNYWRLSPWHTPTLDLRQIRGIATGCEFCSEPTLRRVAENLWGMRRRSA